MLEPLAGSYRTASLPATISTRPLASVCGKRGTTGSSPAAANVPLAGLYISTVRGDVHEDRAVALARSARLGLRLERHDRRIACRQPRRGCGQDIAADRPRDDNKRDDDEDEFSHIPV